MRRRRHASPCKDCTERHVTPEYNCHMHCQKYIKYRLKCELRYRKAMRYLDQKHFMQDEKTVIRRKAVQEQRRSKGKANEK